MSPRGQELGKGAKKKNKKTGRFPPPFFFVCVAHSVLLFFATGAGGGKIQPFFLLPLSPTSPSHPLCMFSILLFFWKFLVSG